jgi:phosphopantetheine--protein transferase-like protein
MRIYGCGIDIEDLARFNKHLQSDSFINLIFSPEEIALLELTDKSRSIPIGFSCKEAFFKAFGISWFNSTLSWKDIRIYFTDTQDPLQYSLKFEGKALELYHQHHIKRVDSTAAIYSDHVVFEAILTS